MKYAHKTRLRPLNEYAGFTVLALLRSERGEERWQFTTYQEAVAFYAQALRSRHLHDYARVNLEGDYYDEDFLELDLVEVGSSIGDVLRAFPMATAFQGW